MFRRMLVAQIFLKKQEIQFRGLAAVPVICETLSNFHGNHAADFVEMNASPRVKFGAYFRQCQIDFRGLKKGAFAINLFANNPAEFGEWNFWGINIIRCSKIARR